jgi:hypothetical protein
MQTITKYVILIDKFAGINVVFTFSEKCVT